MRAPRQLDATVHELSERTGLTRSAIIREAVAEYARSHA
ncbi:MAG: ribbon-helix-helix protein, CopG family [Cellulomonas sp.]|nr:ribbon-helix-helix protein, CopG family [Cellulomonas sp.]